MENDTDLVLNSYLFSRLVQAIKIINTSIQRNKPTNVETGLNLFGKVMDECNNYVNIQSLTNGSNNPSILEYFGLINELRKIQVDKCDEYFKLQKSN